ncbi:MAG: diguanylate cyclase [Rhodocyclaceae bacterium]|jgi:diguanylate cyclase (GGDEF)-like protein
MKILVVEDSPTALQVLCQQVERIGMVPIPARDGLAGMEAYRKHKPDIILLDVVLPETDGFSVAQQIRSLESNGDWTPIIFLTVRANDEDLARGIGVGGDDYLMKPVSEIVLGAKLRAMLRIVDMRRSLLTVSRRLDRANRELRRLSAQDSLTGIANRRYFDETFGREWRRAARNRKAISLVMCDVDYFKQYNDVYGHQAGDECLIQVAQCLAKQARRPGDSVMRYGGEEFAVLLPETDGRGASVLAEKIRAAVEALAIAHAGSEVGKVVTVSAGVASAVPGVAAEKQSDLLQWTDAALYEAKRLGRNQVVSYKLGGGV